MAEDVAFQQWLESTAAHYQKLNDEQRIVALDRLIAISPSSHLYHLSTKLNSLLKRDFIANLPPELSFHILGYLDPNTLCQCCLVSMKWNEVISSCEDAWKAACHKVGVRIQSKTGDSEKSATYKKLYLHSLQRVHHLKKETAFEPKILFGHSDRVMAIYYYKGKIATGSDDHTVRVWDCETGVCEKIIQTHTVADVKFNEQWVLTASFDATAALWDLNTCQCLQQFHGHAATVFSLDFDQELDLLVTGSADSTVRVWSLSTGEMLKTLTDHRSSWIIHVYLHRPHSGDHYYIISTDNVSMYRWQLSLLNHDIVHMSSWETGPQNNDDYRPKESVPGAQVRGSQITHAKLLTSNVPSTELHIVHHDFVRADVEISRLSCSVPKHTRPQAFLGGGDYFHVYLVEDNELPVLAIVSQSDHQRLASIHFTMHYRMSKRGSTFTLGDRSWLDGFDGGNDRGLFFAVVLRDNSIMLLNWKRLKVDDKRSDDIT